MHWQLKAGRRSLAAYAAVGGPVTKKVFFDVKLGDKPAGRIVIGLYGMVAKPQPATMLLG